MFITLSIIYYENILLIGYGDNMSKEQIIFIKSIKRKKIFVFSIQILIIVLFFSIWELLARFELINTFIYSSPSLILDTIFNLFNDNNLFNHVYITLLETVISFILGISLGFIISILLYKFSTLAKIVDPFLTMLNSLPKVALGPLIIIIVGANIKSIIVMALLINIIISIMTIYNGFLDTDKTKIKLFKSLNASNYQILRKLIIPSSYNTIISSLKINISLTLIGVIMGEFLVSRAGIGYLIIYGTQVFNLSLVMTGIFLLVIISFLLYQIIYLIEKKLLNKY